MTQRTEISEIPCHSPPEYSDQGGPSSRSGSHLASPEHKAGEFGFSAGYPGRWVEPVV